MFSGIFLESGSLIRPAGEISCCPTSCWWTIFSHILWDGQLL